MYISEIEIFNFRCFKESTKILLNNGVNVFIGANNSGKTTIIKAMQLLFSEDAKRKLSVGDFHKEISIEELKKRPPKIVITAKIIESAEDEDYSNDLITVSTWLTRIEKPYEARLTYEYYLPEKYIDSYFEIMGNISSQDIEDYWNEVENSFIPKYKYHLLIGDPTYKTLIDYDSLKKFDFQFLKAVRDVERDMFVGSNSLLKEVIDFFIDYDIKNDTKMTSEQKKLEILEKKKDFSAKASSLINDLQVRMKSGKDEMLKYATNTGASFEKLQPAFEGKIYDTELYSALKLIVENETGIKIPAAQNGLGYNNLIYISLLLAKMQKNSSGTYLGTNAKNYSILAIEEPEAHLHPSMQYKLLSFLTSNSKNEVRQVFITSHSPNITAAVKHDNLIVLEHNGNNLKVSYPSKVFSCSMEDQESKLFVERFLDVTRSDMFFAKKIIFVEGLAEQLLVPEFGRMIDKDLIDQHITVINMNGRYFDHFLKLFNLNNSSFAMSKKVVCITDRDPVRKEKKIKSDDESYWKKCHPIFLNFDSEKYEYNPCSNSVLNKDIKFWSKNIGFYSQPMSLGSTLEYQMMLENIECEDLITHSVKNKPELKSLIDYYKKSIDNYKKSQEVDLKTFVDILRSNTTNNELKEIYENHHFEKKEFMKHVIATRYLESIKKGEAAQELSTKVMLINLNNNSDKTEKLDKIELNVPNYISEALKWIFK